MIRDRIEALVRELRDEALRAHDGLQTANGVTNTREVEATYKEQFRIADRLTQLLAEEDGGWSSMDSAPRDGTPILAYGPPSALEPDQLECRETRWSFYGEGSQAKALHDHGLGPSGCWEWREPQSHWLCHWHPTHWRPRPELPPQESSR